MQSDDRIQFNVPTLVGREFDYIRQAIERQQISGNGQFTRACHGFLEKYMGGGKVLLSHSCTSALEMGALLANIEPGDEVLMPSFTFSSTANAFVLRGARPVFVDIRADTLNIDERLIEEAITPKTKAICVVHYAGVGAEMDTIMQIANRRGLAVIEDAAQGLFAYYKDRPLGSFGQFSAFSFHETKNVISGEGGALVVNDPSCAERAEIIWEKGTNRAQFQRGEIAKYTWVDVGSSFLPSELVAAFLLRQLECGEEITETRRRIWRRYFDAFEPLERANVVTRPTVPAHCRANGHIFYLLLSDVGRRDQVLRAIQSQGVAAIMHYVPLHSAPAGIRFGRCAGSMRNTDTLSSALVRLPMHPQLTNDAQDRVIETVSQAIR
jgi:dTDP-4-amino-4,6-dideoxygalactose transaminase